MSRKVVAGRQEWSDTPQGPSSLDQAAACALDYQCAWGASPSSSAALGSSPMPSLLVTKGSRMCPRKGTTSGKLLPEPRGNAPLSLAGTLSTLSAPTPGPHVP